MGISWSNRRRNNFLPNQPLITSYTSDISPVPPPPPLQPPPNYNAPPPYPAPPYPPPNSYPTPPPQPSHPYYYQYSGGGYNTCGYMGPPMVGRGSNYQQQQPYYGNQSNGWQGIQPFVAPPLRLPPPVPLYVENRMAKKIRNDVNVHKDTIKIGVDENNPECHLISFTFDALVDGSITIFYFAKEEADCRFTPLYPEAYLPVRIPFHKGLGQKFSQPSGTGIDLGFFDMDDLSEPSPTEDVFPLVIFAEACSSSLPTDVHFGQHPPISSNAQITQAILENNNGRAFQVKVVKQILWVNQVRYELRDIYGIGNSSEAGFDSNDPGHCVICMSEPKDTAALPCRHMCMCAECAKTLRLRTNKCPICRQPIEELLAIKVNGSDQ